MANQTIRMNKIRLLLRLHAQGCGKKAISAQTGIARNTVKKYLIRFSSLYLTLADLDKLSDHELSLLFCEPKPPQLPDADRYATLEALLPGIEKRLKKKGMTRQRLWQEYREQHPTGYSRSHFSQLLCDYLGRSQPVMHIEHKAGDKLFIDFAGDKLGLVHAQTGEVVPVEVFVAVLGCSQLTYVEAVMSQKKEDLILACENALHYFGGSPAAMVPDNLKSAVTQSGRYEPMLNAAFAAFAEHYSITVLPARAYRPKDKALVEGAVKLIYRSIYPTITEQTHHTLDSLNGAILPLLNAHNDAPFKDREYSRRQQFNDVEKGALQPLPALRHEAKNQVLVTVMKNGHVCLRTDRHYYSVPHRFIGRKVKLIYSSTLVEIYHHYECIAVHGRNTQKHQHTTATEHLPARHRYQSEWSVSWFIEQAGKVGPEVVAFMTKILEGKGHPEHGYKLCSGILRLERKCGPERLRRACQRADSFGIYTYRIVEDILTRNLDAPDVADAESSAEEGIPDHGNIRGRNYYQ